jgi:hypothetical protein
MLALLKANTIRPADTTYNPWITRGIKISCHNKRILCVSCIGSNDTNLRLQYKRYCKMLTDVIKTARKCIMMN